MARGHRAIKNSDFGELCGSPVHSDLSSHALPLLRGHSQGRIEQTDGSDLQRVVHIYWEVGLSI